MPSAHIQKKRLLYRHEYLPSAPTAARRRVGGRVLMPTKCRPKRTASFRLNPNRSVYCENMKINKNTPKRKFLSLLSGCGSRIYPFGYVFGISAPAAHCLHSRCLTDEPTVRVGTKASRCSLLAISQVPAQLLRSLLLSQAALPRSPPVIRPSGS